ncbi:uncharacterized protein LOC110996835 [Pieris rapae]|uniref:uncharacterized protein LOC110996835 n=1 Tax=Pieris rapae TaxID=64459 RepID=UPI001E27CCF6|nr:uncharacterized protein LOC110996835 [Pieris rapae]
MLVIMVLYFLRIASCGGSEVLGLETGIMKMNKNNQETKLKENLEKEPDWSYNPIPKEVSRHVQEFKRNMSECLKEVQRNDRREIKRLSPKMESPVHGECLIACVLKRNGVIENGKVVKDNLIGLITKFYAKEDKLIKKLERNIDRCINTSIKSKDECLLASHLNQCTNDIMANNKHMISV